MADLRPSDRAGDPNVAALLTWFLPGAGHLYLGRAVPALLAFVVIEGLYALGWLLSDGRVLEFLDPELRGPMATLLTPEIGNLGALILQNKLVGFGAGEPSPFPSLALLGGFLTAVSGILNACLMCHAHVLARTGMKTKGVGRSPALYVAAAWLCPGLGHWLQGRRLRAAIVFVMLIGLFVWGTLLCEGTNLSRERHFYYWSGQFLLGLPAFLAEVVSGRPPVTHDMRFVDVGLLYGCLAGLLNVLALLDVYGVAERRWLGQDDAPATGAGAAAEEATR
jgi:hypothetical protein